MMNNGAGGRLSPRPCNVAPLHHARRLRAGHSVTLARSSSLTVLKAYTKIDRMEMNLSATVRLT